MSVVCVENEDSLSFLAGLKNDAVLSKVVDLSFLLLKPKMFVA